jgi:predicted patatin/cPLA2 family phospholipase
LNRKKTALVLEGGGLRGAFTAGVVATLDSLLEKPPDLVFATSAAGPSAAFLATRQTELSIHLWQNRTHGAHLISPMHWLARRPLMDVDKLVDSFRGPRPLNTAALSNSSIEAYLAVTNCQTGGAEHVRLTQENAFALLTATMALPVAYGRVVEINGAPYIDGGVSASIPIEPALERVHDELIVVLTQPLGFRKQAGRSARLTARWAYPKHPALWNAFERRAELYNHALDVVAQLEAAGRASVIRPLAPLPASRMTRNRELILRTIQLGRNSARAWLAARSLETA